MAITIELDLNFAGLFAATIALSGAAILSFFFPENGTITFENKVQTLQYIIGSITIVVFLVALYVWFVLPKQDIETASNP